MKKKDTFKKRKISWFMVHGFFIKKTVHYNSRKIDKKDSTLAGESAGMSHLGSVSSTPRVLALAVLSAATVVWG